MATLPAPLTSALGGSNAWRLGDAAGNIINDAAGELFGSTRDDPFDGVDANFVQLCTLLKRVGRQLVREKQWTHLVREATFISVQGQSSYPLPIDFRGLLNQTAQNRTLRMPVWGPVSPQEWQFLKARLAGVVVNVLFRIVDQEVVLYPDTNTPGGYTIAFEYLSGFWVQSQGQSEADKDAPTAKTDLVLFEPTLAMLGLKLAWLRNKGFESTAAQEDFDQALENAKADDAQAPVLNVAEPNHGGTRMLDMANIPDTGFGT